MQSKKLNVVILGSTGSIGCNSLNVIALNKELYEVYALTANTNVDKLFKQCIDFKPKYAILLDKVEAKNLQIKLSDLNVNTVVLSDRNDLNTISTHSDVDIVMSAIVGSCGLVPTYNAICANKKVLLANKESLIISGKLMMDALKQSSSQLIPVDSEHSAIFQCMEQNYDNVNKIILTASGGPFRTMSKDKIKDVLVSDALNHPNWSMGKKITIDSSTLMNKGLEVIEAYWLFGQNLDKIEVVVHPQSIIHSMVEYIDGSVIAQLGIPDMKTPIAYALAYPKRIVSGSKPLDLTLVSNLTFEKPDYDKFPCLQLAFDAIRAGGVMPAILNAANEVAVGAFLENQISFYKISDLIELALNSFANKDFSTIDEILQIDEEVRQFTLSQINHVDISISV